MQLTLQTSFIKLSFEGDAVDGRTHERSPGAICAQGYQLFASRLMRVTLAMQVVKSIANML